MGGGTSIVEGLLAGRRVVGNDINSLAVFVAKVKTLTLSEASINELKSWDIRLPDVLSYNTPREKVAPYIDNDKVKNLSLVRGRFIKKTIAMALGSIESLSSEEVRQYARCAVLSTAQWALDGKKNHTSLSEFRKKLSNNFNKMLEATQDFGRKLKYLQKSLPTLCTLIEGNADQIDAHPFFSCQGAKVNLVLTSPPYPGVHVLYHRWQVDGRRESPAPYWITGCSDGQGEAFYNFGGRHEVGLNRYFTASLETLRKIRTVMIDGAYMVQLVAFNDPSKYLDRYLNNMKIAGFKEVFVVPPQNNGQVQRIWRQVPSRKWHASLKGSTHSAREVVLIHQAI